MVDCNSLMDGVAVFVVTPLRVYLPSAMHGDLVRQYGLALLELCCQPAVLSR